jgi:hypothetical protein
MNLENQNNNMQELDQRVEQLLTPRFAPSVENFKLELKPRKARYAWLFSAMRISGVAAAMIVGLFALIGPNNTATAKVYAQVAPTFPAPSTAIFFPPLMLAIRIPPFQVV